MSGHPVYIASDHVITSLGDGTDAQIACLRKAQSGIRQIENSLYSSHPVQLSAIDENRFAGFNAGVRFTRLENLFIHSIQQALKSSGIKANDPELLFILSTTKGNVDLLNPSLYPDIDPARLRLGRMAEEIACHIGFLNTPLVVSNACISGVMAQVIASRMIRNGQYRHVVMSGGDILSEFVISGFECLKAISPNPCRPFDVARDGITLGEGVGTLIFTSDASRSAYPGIQVMQGAVSNDANHISGPSRTGEGLVLAIKRTLGPRPDYISAHGTATLYNDEMESKALHSMNLQDIPLNSFKGYIGHTLGAAGLIESIYGLQSMLHGELYASAGYVNSGTEQPVNAIEQYSKSEINHFLKLSSGFGGCNASILFSKI